MTRRLTIRPLLPKEHGAWAMLLIPWVVGVGVARAFGGKDVLLLVALLAAFLAHTQATRWLRLRQGPRPSPEDLRQAGGLGLLLAATSVAAAAPLVAGYRLTGLVPLGLLAVLLGAASLALVSARRERTLAAQLFAPVGLSLSAAVAYYVARSALDRVAFALWGVCALFLLGGIFYVRLKIAALSKRAGPSTLDAKLALAAPTLAMFGVLVVAAYAVVHLGSLSPWALLAFAPTAVQALVGVARLDRPASLKRVGLISTAHTIVFALLVIWLA